MFTVPEEIKELLHRDSSQKNIRIHFPNGERSDICNDMIIKDSVKLTESLCSQNELKFGLCESPVFECSVVGCENVKGARIEVFCEIYCNASVDGSVFRPDLQAYVYPIPYGTFIVSECKRDADMQYRKITAYLVPYDYTIDNSDIYYFLLGKHESSAVTKTINMFDLFLYRNPLNISTINKTERPIEYITSRNTYSWDFNGKNYRIEYYDRDVRLPVDNNLFYLGLIEDVQGESSIKNTVMSQLETLLNLYGAPTYERNALLRAFERYCEAKWRIMREDMIGPNLQQIVYLDVTRNHYSRYCERIYYDGPTVEAGWNLYENNRLKDSKEFIPFTIPSGKYFRIDEELPNIPITFNPTRKRDTANNYNYYSAEDSYKDLKMESIITSSIELMGKLFKKNRFGNIEIINLKQRFGFLPSNELYPGANVYPKGGIGGKIFPQDYQRCWYDDAYTKPYGLVTCIFKDSSSQDIKYDLWLAGFSEESVTDLYQTYDISNNEIIKSKTTWAQEDIEAYCEKIAENIEGVTYMPVELTGRGLPYVEPGDTFEILTRSNDSITTIVLNRTLSGEQVLTDTYKSN